MSEKRLGLIGGASFVGERVYPLLVQEGYRVTSFSRKGGGDTVSLQAAAGGPFPLVADWLCLAPIWALPEHLPFIEKHGGTRLVALSSTSRFTKMASPSAADREVAARLREGEEKVLQWARAQGRTLVILQPTLIYGMGKDKNVTAIAKFIRRFGFFPLFGRGEGLRQPVHVDDIAAACLSALQVPAGRIGAYILSGGEELPYRAMVERIFAALGRRPRFIHCPLFVFALAVRLANFLPPFRELTTEMAVRMNQDQHFAHAEAERDLRFRPRAFYPQRSDVAVDAC